MWGAAEPCSGAAMKKPSERLTEWIALCAAEGGDISRIRDAVRALEAQLEEALTARDYLKAMTLRQARELDELRAEPLHISLGRLNPHR